MPEDSISIPERTVLIPGTLPTDTRTRSLSERLPNFAQQAQIADQLLTAPNTTDLSTVLAKLQGYGVVLEDPKKEDATNSTKLIEDHPTVLLPNAHETFKENDTDTEAARRRLRMTIAPYSYLAECVPDGFEHFVSPLCTELAHQQQRVEDYNELKRLLVSDREEYIHKGLELIATLEGSEQEEWYRWLLSSDDKSLIDLVSNSLKTYGKNPHNYDDFARKPARKPLQPITLSAIDIAQKYPIQPDQLRIFFEGKQVVKEYGTQGGEVTQNEASPFETMFITVMEDLTQNPRAYEATVVRLTNIIDILRYQGQKITLDAPRAIEAIIETCTQLEADGSIGNSTWDMLARFTLPKSAELSASILDSMDKNDGLAHPLAMRLLCDLPEDHPFVQEQYRRISQLNELCTGTPEEVLSRYDDCLKKRKSIIAYYPHGLPSEKVGFDMEVWPKIFGVPLPEHVKMGTDYGGQIPEVRLSDKQNKEFLQYGPEWHKRMYDYWLWLQTAGSDERSVHLHVDQRDFTYESVIKTLYGFNYNDVKIPDDIRTIEVRVPLKDYNASSGGGFKNGAYLHPLADFLLTLRSSPSVDLHTSPTAASTSDNPYKARFENILYVTDNPAIRASGLLAINSNMGLRMVQKPNIHTTNITQEDRYFYTEVIDMVNQIGFLPYEQRKIVFTKVLDQGEVNSTFVAWKLVTTLSREDRIDAIRQLWDTSLVQSRASLLLEVLNASDADGKTDIVVWLRNNNLLYDVMLDIYNPILLSDLTTICVTSIPDDQRLSFIQGLCDRAQVYNTFNIDTLIPNIIEMWPEEERASVIFSLLNDSGYIRGVRISPVNLLNLIPTNQREEVINTLKKNWPNTQNAIDLYIIKTMDVSLLPPSLQRPQLERLLNDQELATKGRHIVLQNLRLWEEHERAPLVKQLIQEDASALTTAITRLRDVPVSDRQDIFDIALATNSESANYYLLSQIRLLPIDIQQHYLLQLEARAPDKVEFAVDTVKCLDLWPEEQKEKIVFQLIDLNAHEILANFHLVPAEIRTTVLNKILIRADHDSFIIQKAIMCIRLVPENERNQILTAMLTKLKHSPDSIKRNMLHALYTQLDHISLSVLARLYEQSRIDSSTGQLIENYQNMDNPQWIPITHMNINRSMAT